MILALYTIIWICRLGHGSHVKHTVIRHLSPLEWKLNIYAPEYEKIIDDNENRPLDKKKLIIMIKKRAGKSA